MQLHAIRIEIPADTNIIVGQSHFIKTVEDLYEAMVTSVPGAAFGVAFAEASGACLVRSDGNDEGLRELAAEIIEKLGCGHVFVVLLRNAYPINVLNRIKDCPEVCRIYCATANPLEVIVAETEQGRGVMGVVDGARPNGLEQDGDRQWRREFLRRIGYKR